MIFAARYGRTTGSARAIPLGRRTSAIGRSRWLDWPPELCASVSEGVVTKAITGWLQSSFGRSECRPAQLCAAANRLTADIGEHTCLPLTAGRICGNQKVRTPFPRGCVAPIVAGPNPQPSRSLAAETTGRKKRGT